MFAGMRGTQDFLRHAKLIISTNDHRVYKKSGGLRQAQEDFKAVQPTSIQETKVINSLCFFQEINSLIQSNETKQAKPGIFFFNLILHENVMLFD